MPNGHSGRSSFRRRCTWTVWHRCVYGSASSIRRTAQNATRTPATDKCTVFRLSEWERGEKSNISDCKQAEAIWSGGKVAAMPRWLSLLAVFLDMGMHFYGLRISRHVEKRSSSTSSLVRCQLTRIDGTAWAVISVISCFIVIVMAHILRCVTKALRGWHAHPGVNETVLTQNCFHIAKGKFASLRLTEGRNKIIRNSVETHKNQLFLSVRKPGVMCPMRQNDPWSLFKILAQ